jgi:hypothetical protein
MKVTTVFFLFFTRIFAAFSSVKIQKNPVRRPAWELRKNSFVTFNKTGNYQVSEN